MRTRVFLLLILTLSLIIFANQLIQVNIENRRLIYRPEIIVYTAMDKQITDEYEKKFEEETGINVQLISMKTQEIIKQLEKEEKNPQADMIWGVAMSSVTGIVYKGLLSPYGNIEMASDIKKLNNKYGLGENKYLIGIREWSPIVCVNLMLLNESEYPKTWADLIKEDYEKQIVMPSPTKTGTGFLIISSILYNDFAGLEDEKWEDLEKFNENIAEYTQKGSTPCMKVADGTYPIGISYGDTVYINQFKDFISIPSDEALDEALDETVLKNANGDVVVKFYFLDDKVAWELDVVALVNKGTENPYVSSFFEWLVKQDAYDIYQKNTYVKGANKRDIHIFPWMASQREAILTKWEDEDTFMSKVADDKKEKAFRKNFTIK